MIPSYKIIKIFQQAFHKFKNKQAKLRFFFGFFLNEIQNLYYFIYLQRNGISFDIMFMFMFCFIKSYTP